MSVPSHHPVPEDASIPGACELCAGREGPSLLPSITHDAGESRGVCSPAAVQEMQLQGATIMAADGQGTDGPGGVLNIAPDLTVSQISLTRN